MLRSKSLEFACSRYAWVTHQVLRVDVPRPRTVQLPLRRPLISSMRRNDSIGLAYKKCALVRTIEWMLKLGNRRAQALSNRALVEMFDAARPPCILRIIHARSLVSPTAAFVIATNRYMCVLFPQCAIAFRSSLLYAHIYSLYRRITHSRRRRSQRGNHIIGVLGVVAVCGKSTRKR